MNLVPNVVSRLGYRSVLKIRGGSPTILVVAGVVGLGASAVLAAKATRHLDPILEEHEKSRAEIGYVGQNHDRQKELVVLYLNSTFELTKLYGPALFVGSCSAVAVLGGHKILRSRHLATVAAYSGLVEQFQAYRGRVAKTLGEDVERGIYEGAHGEYTETENKGEYKLTPKFGDDKATSYLRPWFDETNPNWTRDPQWNYMFLKGIQQHMNHILQSRGHVFLNEVFDALSLPHTQEGAVMGWIFEDKGAGDGYVDFGFMSSIDPNTVAFCNGVERVVRLNFNVDSLPIWDRI